MYFMYVDESGDPGLTDSPTRYFVLSGLVLHESRWGHYLAELTAFRKRLRTGFGLLLREEIHAAHFISKPGPIMRIPRNDRLSILRFLADQLSCMTDLRLLNIVVDKRGKAPDYDVFETAWSALLQCFEQALESKNLPSSTNPRDWGLILPDYTDTKKLTRLLRRMRLYTLAPNEPAYGPGCRDTLVSNVVEDPYFKRSDHSYFIQSCDLAAYLLYQELSPCAYMRRKGGHRYFRRLQSILCANRSTSDPSGVLRL